jgi:hypothetical protein
MSLDQLPPWLTYAASVVLVASPFVFVAQALAHRWLKHSAKTPSPHDDRAARALVKFTDFLAAIVLAVPRVTVDLTKLLQMARTVASIPRPRPPASGALLILLVLLPLSGYSTGCATTEMQRARMGIGMSLDAMHVIDDAFDPRYRAAQARVASGEVPEDEVDAFVRRWNSAAYAIVSAVTALRTAETTLDAIEAGQAGDIHGVLSCVGVAVIDVIDKLPSVGIEIPEMLDMALRMVMTFVGTGGTCEPADHASTGVPHMSEAIAVTP